MEDHDKHQQTTVLAYQFWRERGCPMGSADEDWFRAEHALQLQHAGRIEADARDEGSTQVVRDPVEAAIGGALGASHTSAA
jgi:hypothetical protein